MPDLDGDEFDAKLIFPWAAKVVPLARQTFANDSDELFIMPSIPSTFDSKNSTPNPYVNKFGAIDRIT